MIRYYFFRQTSLMKTAGVTCSCSNLCRPISSTSSCKNRRPSKLNRNNIASGGGKLRKSSRDWLRRQEKDEYVKKARKDGSPSRSIFKLEEIVKNIHNLKKKNLKHLSIDFDFFQKDDAVIDLGAAPGGWSLFTSRLLGANGLLISVDLLPLDSNVVKSISMNKSMPPLHTIEGDFTEDSVKQAIINIVNANEVEQKINRNGGKVDCIISDMAANFTGDRITDALRTMNLCEDAMMFAAGSSCFEDGSAEKYNDDALLRAGGTFICKFFACGEENEKDLLTAAKSRFQYTNIVKPKASRKESAELYLYATGYRGEH